MSDLRCDVHVIDANLSPPLTLTLEQQTETADRA